MSKYDPRVKSFSATITTRYGLPEKNIYEQVIDLVKKENIARSRAQLLLVERGLQHTHNPEPLVKEKVVYKDKIVYRDRPEGKHLSPPEGIQEHITDEQIGGSNTGQRASGDNLTIRDKADPPHTALEEKKSPSDTTRDSLNWVGWLGLSGVIGFIAYRVYQVYYLGKP